MVSIRVKETLADAQVKKIAKEANNQIKSALSQQDRAALAQLEGLADQLLKKREQRRISIKDTEAAVATLNELSNEQIEVLSRSLLLNSTIDHSIADFKHAENETPIEVEVENFIRDLITTAEDPRAALARTAETIKNTIQSQTHTYHPQVYQNALGREFLSETTRALQSARQDPHGGMNSITLHSIENRVSGLVSEVMQRNRDLTPQRQIDIGTEGAYEVKNIAAMRNNRSDFVRIWNQVVTKLSKDEKFLAQISSSQAEVAALKVSTKRWQMRTWGGRIPSADSDGRTEATSHALGRSIYGGCVNIEGQLTFIDVSHDLRLNSEVLTDMIGGLIQRAYRRSKGKVAKSEDDISIPSVDGGQFAAMNDAFVRNAYGASGESENKWAEEGASSKYIYQELPLEKRAEFARVMLLKQDIELIPSEIKDSKNGYVIKFNEAYRQILKKYNMQDRGWGRIDVETQALIENDLVDAGFNLTDKGRGYDLAKDVIKEGRPAFIRKFLNHTRVLDKNEKHKKVDDGQAITIMDALRRFIVVNEALDKVKSGEIKCPDEPIADRVQAANFSSKAGFYEMLIALKETGLLQIKGEKVVNAKIGFQPLIETIKDMRNAPQIFRELLQDPLVLSYYKQRGVAEFMIGFSDGAKTGGNLASEWGLYKLQRQLNEIFMEHKAELGPDFKVRYFEGRGRRENRGGSIDSRLSAEMTPDEVAVHAIRDETIQADHAGEAFSNPQFGIKDVCGRFLGTVKARERALTRSEAEKKHLAQLENVVDFLADFSAMNFEGKVRRHSEIQIFIDGMPFNSNISSRKSERPDSVKEGWDAKRAVPVEAMGADSDLPFHYVGISEAIEAFTNPQAKNVEIKEFDEDSKPQGWKTIKTYDLSSFGDVTARKKLLGQVSGHPFMNAFLKRAEVGISNFNPEIAGLYGKITGAVTFVKSAIDSLSNLKDSLPLLRANPQGKQATTRIRQNADIVQKASPAAERNDVMAHLLLAALAKKHGSLPKIDAREFPAAKHAVNNILAVNFHAYAESGIKQEKQASVRAA